MSIDNQVEALLDSECPYCQLKYKILEVFATTVETSCACGPSEFDLEPEGELPEEAIRY